MTARIYLDHNATTALRPEAAAAVRAWLGEIGNPSSVHAEGRAARARIENAREEVARLVAAEPRNVAFTGSATEALNLVLTPDLVLPGDDRPWRLLLSPVEHAAVLRGHRFLADRVEILRVDGEGVLDLDHLGAILARQDAGRPLLALQLANNETGVIQPVAEATALVRAAGGASVVDAVQAARFMACSLAGLGADALVLSGHKLGGLSGAGALVRRSALHVPSGIVRGGGQEGGLSAGTHNVAGIASFGAAAAATLAAREAEAARLAALRDRLETGLRAQGHGIVVFGAGADRLPNTTGFAVPGTSAETMLMRFDLAGIAISSGSACSSGRVEPSQVLDAMGFNHDLQSGMLRVSTGWTTSERDVERFLEVWSATLDGISVPGERVTA